MTDPSTLAEKLSRKLFVGGATHPTYFAEQVIEARDKEWRERESELLAIIEGLQDVANGDVTKIRRGHIDEDVSAMFKRIRHE